MKRLMTIMLIFAATLLGLPLASGVAQSGTEMYMLVITLPNMGEAPNGDRVAVTGMGTFQVNPKEVTADGTFVHRDSTGTELGRGTWTATELLSFQPYGCGIITFPDPDVILPPNFCGGALKLRVLLITPVGAFDAILTVFCIVGPKAPESHNEPAEEGVTLNVADVINFNQVAPGGANIYIRTSP